MTDKYRKLSVSEVKELVDRLSGNSNAPSELTSYVNQYYLKDKAISAELIYDSEYNDSTYDNKLRYILVRDAEGNELLPLRGKEIDARINIPDIEPPGTCDKYDGTMEPVSSPIRYFLKEAKPPELFVKIG